MKIIITAGGTTEKIDPVRKITNTATGKLGSLIAEEFVKQAGSRIEKIFYICEKGTVIPESACVEVVTVEGVGEVKNALCEILTANKIDAVIHSMAVSDYTVERMTTAEGLSEFIANKLFATQKAELESESSLTELIAGYIKENDRLIDNNKKVGSNFKNLILTMKQTPKLIGLIKALQPSTVLVGFKLLNGVEKQTLIDAGYGVLEKNSCDFVLANDLREIGGGRHTGYLISPDKSYTRLETKEEIAGEIVRKVIYTLEKKVC